MKKKGFINNKKGTTMILISMMMVVILGFASLTIDIGLTTFEKAKIGNAVDAAVLAGAQELANGRGSENAEEMAMEYLQKNGVDTEDAVVTITENSINVAALKDFDYYFAKILGFDKGSVNKDATVDVGAVSGVYRGIRPFAIEDMSLDFGQTYVLKEGGGSGSNGNYGALALGGNGASNYQNNIINGYNGHLKVGDYVDTEPGNMSGPTSQGITTLLNQCQRVPKCTFDNYDADCPKIITVIIVESLDVNGRKPVKIVGFASFFLEGVAGQGNKSIVTGKFIRNVIEGDISTSQTDYGLKAMKLVH